MEYYCMLLIILPIIFTILYLLNRSPTLSSSKLPPGPKTWPIIGNIHQLGTKPHRSLAQLAKIHGPIMSLKLGTLTTIVISSPEVAKEMFVKHDSTFAGRKIPAGGRIANYEKHSMVWLSVCPKWRELRKIVTIQLFTHQRLDSSQGLRMKKVEELVEYARDCCAEGRPMDISQAGVTTSLNLLSNTFFSSDLSSYDSSYAQEFKELTWSMLEEGAKPNVSDFFPLVRGLDLQGIRRRIGVSMNKMIGIFEEIIDQRLRDSNLVKDDVLGTLLNLVKNNELGLEDIKYMLIDLFIAGTDTSSSTLEWAMTELLRNPDKMEKAQFEIDQVIGKDGSIQESDISKLSYIQAVVKETLRMHPPAPFLIPHRTEKDVELCGYFLPKNAQVLVNVWSIGHDPSVWENPDLFLPERFLDKEIDVKGQNFELIPFGAGRRMCPGMPLAYRMTLGGNF